MRNRFPYLILAATTAAVLTASIADAQTPERSRYGSDWGQRADSQNEQQRIDAMIADLRRLIAAADKARAADPVFLRDLNELARRYSWPWDVRVLFDDFNDGDLSRDPAWTIEGGDILTNRYVGVRTIVVPRGAYRDERPSQRQSDRGDLARQIIGTILQGQQQGTREEPRHRYGPREAVMAAPVRVSNAFALQVRLSSETTDPGRIEFGVTQGAGGAGYRFAYNPKGSPSFEILRVGSSGTAVIEASRAATALEDRAFHEIQFTRANNGRMTLSVDGKDVIDTIDRAFRDTFDGVVLRNAGGDFTVRQIALYGAR